MIVEQIKEGEFCMFNVFALIPLVFFLISSYFFNRNKLIESKDRIILISAFEAFFCYFLVTLIFLESFLRNFLVYLLIIFLMLFILIVILTIQKENDEDWDLKIETMKNNIILFFLTLAPFYLFLTIFRFQNLLNQVLFSFLGIVVIYFVELLLKKIMKPVWEKIVFFFETEGLKKYVSIFILIVGLGLFSWMFDLPFGKVKHSLNLNDYVGYFSFDGYERHLNQQFKSDKNFTFKFPLDINSSVLDYYHDDSSVYFYTSDNKIGKIDKQSNRLVYIDALSDYLEQDPYDITDINIIRKLFFIENNELYILSKSGIYLATETGFTEIHDEITSTNSSIFYVDNQIHFLKTAIDETYFDYIMVDGVISVNQMLTTGSVGVHDIKEYLVISERLFFKESGLTLFLHSNPNDSFFVRPGYPVYDEVNDYMYFSRNLNYYLPIRRDTAYFKVPILGRDTSITFEKQFNMTAYIVGENVYLFDMNPGFERIEIINKDFEITAVSYPIKSEPFWFDNQIVKRYVGNVKDNNNVLEYLLVEHSSNQVTLSIHTLTERQTGMNLPFYSHHGLWMFIPVFIAMLIPMTHYRQHITIISFDEITKKR
jgi:hypothetical protein